MSSRDGKKTGYNESLPPAIDLFSKPSEWLETIRWYTAELSSGCVSLGLRPHRRMSYLPPSLAVLAALVRLVMPSNFGEDAEPRCICCYALSIASRVAAKACPLLRIKVS